MTKKSEIDHLIFIFSKLPGLGPRSARRIILHLLKDKEARMQALINSLIETYEKILPCITCGNYCSSDICNICHDNNRDKTVIAVVETVADLWAIERSSVFKGTYHVLGSNLSSRDAKIAQHSLEKLKNRIVSQEVTELILATNSTLEGQTTAFYIMDFMRKANLKISRLASGIPIGGELDYLDEGTLSAALFSRTPFDV